MREQLARIAVVLSVVTVLALAFASARMRQARSTDAARPASAEPVAAAAATPSHAPLTELEIRGRTIYAAQGCSGCHSISGAGSPRYPLDGVGARHGVEALRAWIVADPSLADSLPASTFRRKQRYQRLPAEDLDALVAYLATLRP